MEKRNNRRKSFIGIVVSDKMMKTRVVQVSFNDRHPRYGKLLVRHNRYKAHDEKNESHTGDKVLMWESRPLSKDKRWIITKIIEKNAIKEAVQA